jgi:hypothetical protein
MTPCRIVWDVLPDLEYGDTALLRNTATYQVTRCNIPDDMNLISTAMRASNLSSILVFFFSGALSYKDDTTSMSD